MRWIEKGQEPESFTTWKAQANEDWQPSFNDLRGQEKRDLYAALLQEQGYLCCYCMMRITNSNNSAQADREDSDPCHIEHLKPQARFPQLALDYNNLLASCQAERAKNPPPPSRCGYKKDNWTDEEIDKLIKELRRCDHQGQYVPFSTAVIFVLQSYL